MSSTSKTLSKATKVHVEIPSETLRSKRRAKFHDPTVKCAFDSSGIDEPLHMFYIFGICKYDIYFFRFQWRHQGSTSGKTSKFWTWRFYVFFP